MKIMFWCLAAGLLVVLAAYSAARDSAGVCGAALHYLQRVPMTSLQRARRLLIRRGSFRVLAIYTFLLLLGALADRIT